MKATRYTASKLPADIIQRINSTSLLSSTAFAGLFRTMGGRDVYWFVRDNARPLAVMTGVEFGRKPISRFQAMPDGLYGQLLPMDDGPDVGKETAQAVLEALSGAGYAKLFLTDFYGQFDSTGGFESENGLTTLVDISDPDWQPPDKKIRSEIRKAEREGIRVLNFDPDQHFDKFIGLMQDTESRHDREPKYSPEFFEALARLSQIDKRIHWLYVEADSQAAASHIYLIEKDMALNWQIYFDKSFSYLKPNQYLLFDTAGRLRNLGVKTLNLGATPADATGLVAQKDKWGGREYRYKCLTAKSGLGRLV